MRTISGFKTWTVAKKVAAASPGEQLGASWVTLHLSRVNQVKGGKMEAPQTEDRQSPRPGPSGLQAPPAPQQPRNDAQENEFPSDPPFTQGEVVYDHNGISASLELSHTSFYSRFGWRDHLYNIDFQVHEPEDSLLLDLNSVVADCLAKLLDKLKQQYAATSEDPRCDPL